MGSLEKRKRIQFVYKTTNLLNGTYYIGYHSAWKIEDGYLGSGKRLIRSVNKYGKENFEREVLKIFDTREEALKYEAYLVNEELLKDELCLNLKPGGSGGFSKEDAIKGSRLGGISTSNKRKSDKEFDILIREKKSNSMKEVWSSGLWDMTNMGKSFLGKSHTEETKLQMQQSAKNKGPEKNSQYGTCWITNGIENKKIHKGDMIPDGWRLGRKVK